MDNLREKIADELFCTMNPNRTVSFRQFIEQYGKKGDLYYKATNQILALIKEALPELAKEKGW